MLNIFISALIAIFFLGNSSKDIREKTRRASKFRTTIYLIFTIIFVVIFYKSYQVSTIINIVDLKALRGAEDVNKQSKDTIESITIYNKFMSLGAYNNDILNVINKYKRYNFYTENGGVFVRINVANRDTDTINNRGVFTNATYELLENEFGKDVSNFGQLYSLAFISTNIPSFIPIYPEINHYTGLYYENGAYYWSMENNSRLNNNITMKRPEEKDMKRVSSYEGAMKVFENGETVEKYMAIDKRIKNLSSKYHMSYSDKIANKIDFFTASDISQYTYVYCINSDMPVKKLNVEYNLPVEISNANDGIIVRTNGFGMGKASLKKLGSEIAMCHVKLPTMENLQLIRSMIITAILTTFFSLFCTNLYYCVRKKSNKYYKKHKLSYSILRRISRKRINFFKMYVRFIALGLVVLFLYFSLVVLSNKPYIISFYHIEYYIAAIILIIIAFLSISIFYLYKFAITPLPKLRGTEKLKSKDEKKSANNNKSKKR